MRFIYIQSFRNHAKSEKLTFRLLGPAAVVDTKIWLSCLIGMLCFATVVKFMVKKVNPKSGN